MMSDHYKPARYYNKHSIYDEITDTVQGSDGQIHVVTMRYWHWHNLDWIKRNTRTKEEYLVDNAYIGLSDVPNGTMSKAMEASIFYYVEAFFRTRDKRLKKQNEENNFSEDQ